jgi:hypothetical protein
MASVGVKMHVIPLRHGQSDFTPPFSDEHIVLRKNITGTSAAAASDPFTPKLPKVLASFAAGLKNREITLDIQEPYCGGPAAVSSRALCDQRPRKDHGSQEAVAELTVVHLLLSRTGSAGRKRIWRGRTEKLEVVVVGHACGGF